MNELLIFVHKQSPGSLVTTCDRRQLVTNSLCWVWILQVIKFYDQLIIIVISNHCGPQIYPLQVIMKVCFAFLMIYCASMICMHFLCRISKLRITLMTCKNAKMQKYKNAHICDCYVKIHKHKIQNTHICDCDVKIQVATPATSACLSGAAAEAQTISPLRKFICKIF